jgi:hypothetical protein
VGLAGSAGVVAGPAGMGVAGAVGPNHIAGNAAGSAGVSPAPSGGAASRSGEREGMVLSTATSAVGRAPGRVVLQEFDVELAQPARRQDVEGVLPDLLGRADAGKRQEEAEATHVKIGEVFPLLEAKSRSEVGFDAAAETVYISTKTER